MKPEKVDAVTQYIEQMKVGESTIAREVANWIKQNIPSLLRRLRIVDGRSVDDVMGKAKCLYPTSVIDTGAVYVTQPAICRSYERTFSPIEEPSGCDSCELKNLGCHMWRKERSFIHTIFGRLGDLFARNRN